MSVPTTRRLAGLFLLVAVAACSRQRDPDPASRGEIDDHAPIRATASVVIDATPSDVWGVLADVRSWPAWQHDIRATTIGRAPAVGVKFRWSISGGTIRSRFTVFDPAHRLAWSGSLFVFHAVHVWILRTQPDGETRVETRESLSGWPIGWLYSSADLLEANRRWLAALKIEVEARHMAPTRG
ncbi:SRPBCC family protein [Lichenicola sp.]|uniref:SRPBCC family protein n=1 Tax=Lichenicola sp. TaxID=2804529 RepID=UPI003B0086B9